MDKADDDNNDRCDPTGRQFYSTDPKSSNPTLIKTHLNKKNSKHKIVEETKIAHFKELTKTFQVIQSEKCLSSNSKVGSLPMSHRPDLKKDSIIHLVKSNTLESTNAQSVTANEQKQYNKPKQKSNGSAEQTTRNPTFKGFDSRKPMLSEALRSSVASEDVPNVETISGNKKTSKKKKRKLSAKARRQALKRLLASHPFIEHMQTSVNLEQDSDVVRELNKVLQDKSTPTELHKDIVDYLAKVSNKEPLGSETCDPDVAQHVQGDKKNAKASDSSEPLWSTADLEDPERLKEITSEVVKMFHPELNKQAKGRALRMDAERRVALYHQEVAAYMDACILTGMLKRAHVLLLGPDLAKKKGRRRTHKKVTDVTLFNTMMHAWAKKGNLDRIRELFRYVEEEPGMNPTLQSYAAVLEYMGRQFVMPVETLKKVLEDISSRGYKIEDIHVSCALSSAEWLSIQRAIQKVSPGFSPKTAVTTDLNYNCELLENSKEWASNNPFSGLVNSEDLKRKADTQMTLELSDKITVESILPEVKVTPHIKRMRGLLNKTKEKWKLVLRQGFVREVEKLDQKAKDDFTTGNIVPYMKLFPPSTYIDLMIQQIDLISQEMESFSPPLTYIHSTLGFRLYHKLQLLLKQKHNQVEKMSALYEQYIEHYNSDTTDCNMRQAWQKLLETQPDAAFMNKATHKWPNYVAKSVGRFLLNIIMNEAKVDANIFKATKDRSEIPAFYSVPRNRNNVPQDEIKPHPVLVKLQKEAHVRDLIFQPEDMPSLVPPVPWTSVDIGGNLLCTTELVKNASAHVSVHRKVPSQQLYPVFDSLNTVSSVPWKINQPVLDTIIQVFNKGGAPDIDIPEPISKLPAPPKFLLDMTPEERTAVIIERNKLNKKKKEMFSLWCTELYRLSIAHKHRGDIFWFPHNLDFRSRFYAVPPHFNHLGSDVARSILVFAKGKQLGKDGLDWLKIHLVNLTGFKKRSSNRERLEFANDLMEDILDSADKPLTGKQWWQTSDEPWQTLACCMEIANASRSPDPTKYTCHFPVHQDGSCNGLQHYAALGRDQAGAESVNLHPFDSPKDVYSDIVEMVEEERKKDAAMGKEVAQILDGFIKRKVIKQTIMTTVYGVTKYGARQQIRGQLEDIGDFPQKDVWDSMFYLTDKTFLCLQQMFTSTKEIQDWFVLCAELIARVCYQPVEWVTPVGWPVLQPYYRHTYIQRPDKPEKSISVEKPNAIKQKNAFPPNFIHSLDSAHMMLTSIECLRHGVNFVAVHDCFWTHASDVDVMNRVCREQFVALHTQPILEDLALFLLDRFGLPERENDPSKKRLNEAKDFVNHILGKLPSRGEFHIDKVLDSTYFFS